MDQWFSIKTQEKETIALLVKKIDAELNEEITFDQLAGWIHSKRIQHGVHNDVLQQIIENIDTIEFPIEIAKGQLPIDGAPAELVPVVGPAAAKDFQAEEKVDFKRLFTIPTVSSGQLLAQKKTATEGKPGVTVSGKLLPAKKGKDLIVKNGDNTVFNPENLGVYATASGEVSFKANKVHVYPVYKVNGDVSLKTGHIDFVGNVHVTGDVPSGYKINAQGDIRIEGVVEAAEIVTPGNIVIAGGVLGQGKGSIRCGGNFTSLYINQGTVIAGENIEVVQTIMHSHCEAGRNITCISGKGNITGGSCSAGYIITANEIGNETYSKTLLYMKTKEMDRNVINDVEQKINELQSSLEKLQQLKDAMIRQSLHNNNDNQATISRVEMTLNQTAAKLTEMYIEKNNLVAQNQEDVSQVIIKGTLHPNVEISMGKYKRKVQSPFQSAKVYMEDKEIIINSL